jgi:hypothetical protein
MGTEELAVKLFLTWLVTQCVFARLLFLLVMENLPALHINPDYIGWIVFFTAAVIIAETITSATLLYPFMEAAARRI